MVVAGAVGGVCGVFPADWFFGGLCCVCVVAAYGCYVGGDFFGDVADDGGAVGVVGVYSSG